MGCRGGCRPWYLLLPKCAPEAPHSSHWKESLEALREDVGRLAPSPAGPEPWSWGHSDRVVGGGSASRPSPLPEEVLGLAVPAGATLTADLRGTLTPDPSRGREGFLHLGPGWTSKRQLASAERGSSACPACPVRLRRLEVV